MGQFVLARPSTVTWCRRWSKAIGNLIRRYAFWGNLFSSYIFPLQFLVYWRIRTYKSTPSHHPDMPSKLPHLPLPLKRSHVESSSLGKSMSHARGIKWMREMTRDKSPYKVGLIYMVHRLLKLFSTPSC